MALVRILSPHYNEDTMKNKYLLSLLFSGALFLSFPFMLQAVIQDTDLDSLTDESEGSTYHTNPQLSDTDGDGISDGDEILQSTNPLDPQSSRLLELKKGDPGILGIPEKRAWYLGRASGIAAYILFLLVVIHGLIMTTRVWTKIFSMATIYSLHQYLSIAAFAITLLHLTCFFFDQYLKITLSETFIPFLLSRPFSSVFGFNIGRAVALGIIAFYLAIVLIVTSLYRHKIPHRLWRGLHYLAFLFYILITLHGVTTGSDSAILSVRILYISGFSLVSLLIIFRIVKAWYSPQYPSPVTSKSPALPTLPEKES